MAQSLTGNAVELQDKFRKVYPDNPVAFVGSDVEKLKIFNVLTELKLASRVGPIPDRGSKEEKEAKAKAKDGLQTNLFKDEATNSVYEVADQPSAIISITGDAVDLPEDHELENAVASLTKFCRERTLNKFVLSSEAAHRAILANYVYREGQIKEIYDSHEHKELKLKLGLEDAKFKSMQISHLLGIRIQILNQYANDQNANGWMKKNIGSLSKCFKYPSVRDVLLDITKTWMDSFKKLLSSDFDFPELQGATEPNSASNREVEPISCGKRLSKSRLAKFFESGIMGAAVKLSGPNGSPWIVDGGSNGGVMKMAGDSRLNMRSVGKSIQLIGIGVATNKIENYDVEGHSHLILAVDREQNCPVKTDEKGQQSTAFGYEIEYTKLFEDSLSTVFGVPIVGVLVGGGPGSLQNVVEAIAGNFPVVVIKGTGRVADLICAIRERMPIAYVKHQCKVLNVDFERVKKCSSYRKLEILDLNWRNSETFVEFVQSQVRSYHAKGFSHKKLSYRSSNVKELFKLFYHTPKDRRLLELVTNEPKANSFAIWSLTFGIAQVDGKDDFARTFEFQQPPLQPSLQPLSCLKCAECIVEVMRLLFPLPVALFSYFTDNMDSKKQDKNEMNDFIKSNKFLETISPFYIWSMHPGTTAVAEAEENTDSFHIRVHVFSKNAEKDKVREVFCLFKGLSGIKLLELQNSISSCLHNEFGIVSIAFAEVSRVVEEKASASEPVVNLPKFARLFKAISYSCLQSTNVLLKFRDTPPEVMPEVSILEQTLDVFGMYKEFVAGFFMDLKDELQQRIHWEDKDGICKTVYERISRSPAVSLPIYFFELGQNAQNRIVGSLPDDFLLCKPLNDDLNAEINSRDANWNLLCLSSWKNKEDIGAVGRYEHDFDFPFLEGNAMKNWTTYFEYLYLNCNDDRPYAPCWDPIALQQKADEIRGRFQTKIKTEGENASGHLTYLVTTSYSQFRALVMQDVKAVWDGIQKNQHYSSRDLVAMMNRLQLAMKKVFYFSFCCKRIVLCEGCCRQFGLKWPISDTSQKQALSDTSHALKCSNYDHCGISKGQDQTVPLCSDFGRSGLQIVYPENSQKEFRKRKCHLKRFCFRWLIEVAFDLKKACSTSFLRHSFSGDSTKNDGSKVKVINLSSRTKNGIEPINVEERSRLCFFLSEIVELCKSGRLMLINEVKSVPSMLMKDETSIEDQILHAIIMAEKVNRVVSECDVLKTGCSVYERFPHIEDHLSINRVQSQRKENSGTSVPVDSSPSSPSKLFSQKSRRGSIAYTQELVTNIKNSQVHMTHLIVAAIEGNADKAHQYMSRADLDYIFHQYIDNNELDPRRCGSSFRVGSCALHMALERGHTDVAIKIIDRVYNLAREELFEFYPKEAKMKFLYRLFIGTTIFVSSDHAQIQLKIPTSFMYLARYSMKNEMDKFIEILKRLTKLEEYQNDISRYIIEPTDSNGLNALHYAVLSQSPTCVSWFVPLMHVFRVCYSSSNSTFVPLGPNLPAKQDDDPVQKLKTISNQMYGDPNPFSSGDCQFLRMHRSKDFSDADRRLSVCEDWIQTHHCTDTNMSLDDVSKQHMEISPYELALLVWRLLDFQSMLSQEMLYNVATNVITNDKQPSAWRLKSKNESAAKSEKSDEYSWFRRCKFSNKVADESSSGTSDKFDDEDDHEDDLSHERLAESYRDRSAALCTILSDLEVAANRELGIDSKKKVGLKELSDYRSHRAVSRMVFPGLSYLFYVFFATLMAILMTNGLFDEPTKFTHAVVNELGWNNPQKAISEIASFSDLTMWWGVLAGFLWESSPMAKPFATYNLLGPVLVRQIRTDRSSCNNGQARCTPSNYRSITFSSLDNPDAPYPTPLYLDFIDSKTPFSFFDNGGREFTIPFTEDVVNSQWGNEYHYSGGGYALTFACPTNESVSSHSCRDQPSSGHSRCNCSQRFLDLMPISTEGHDPVSTFLDEGTRALDVSFLVFSPSLQSYVFVHVLIEFSETGSISVWDDYQSFSGRYSKQFDFSERMTSLRISQYVTIIYALMYLVYERTDWNVLRSRIPDRLDPSKSKQHARMWQEFKDGLLGISQTPVSSTLKWLRHYVSFHYRRFVCHWELFLTKSEYYGKIYQLLELIGLGCGYSVIVLDLVLQSRLRTLFSLAKAGKFNDPSSIEPSTGMSIHRSISDAHTLLATEREVIGAYMFFTWTRVFAYLVHMPGWGPYLHAIIATIFSGVVLAFVLVVVLLNAAFAIMMYCSYSLTGGDDFKTLQDSFFSMWRMLMGFNEVFSFVENNRGLSGPKFSKGSSGAAFIFLSILGNLIVMNVIVGLLGEQYQKFGQLSIANFNRELNANLAKDIIAIKTAEGLNPFGERIQIRLFNRCFQMNIGFTFFDRWKVDAKSNKALKFLLFVEGYYLDWLSGLIFRWKRLNSPAALFRLKWFHGGVAQERIVCQRMLKFINISTTPISPEAAKDIASSQTEQQATEVHH